jgi:hypothetical protein
MKGYTLANAIGDFSTIDEALAWLGDGGMVNVWSTVPGVLLHADLYIETTGHTRVTLYDTFNHRAGDFYFETAGHAVGFARSYVVGACK